MRGDRRQMCRKSSQVRDSRGQMCSHSESSKVRSESSQMRGAGREVCRDRCQVRCGCWLSQ